MKDTKQSKIESLERPAQRATCVIESLENRQLFTSIPNLQIDFAHTFKVTDQSDNYESQIMRLSDSRFLLRWVYTTFDPIDTYYTFFRVFPATSAFNNGKVLRLANQNHLTPDFQLGDGSILIHDSVGHYYKLLFSGKLDTQFGEKGSIKPLAESLSDEKIVEVNGNLVRYSVLDEKKEIVISIFSRDGKSRSKTTTVFNDNSNFHSIPYIFPDGDALIQGDNDYRRYNSDGTLDRTFGDNGILNLNSNTRYRRWAKKQVWKDMLDGEPIVHRPGFVPLLTGSPEGGSQEGTLNFRVATDRSFTESISTSYHTDFEHSTNYLATTLAMIYGFNGQPQTFHPNEPKWTKAGYRVHQPSSDESGPGALSASIQLATGQTVTFDPAKSDSRFSGLIQAGGPVNDGRGGLYFLGSFYDDHVPGRSSVWAIHTTPFIGTISGRAFADKNADGVRQTGEKLLANQQVYIDENSDGKFDEDELNTYTDSKGHYQFTGLYKGSYKVRIVPPKNQHVTTPAFSTGLITLKLGQSKWGEIGVSV